MAPQMRKIVGIPLIIYGFFVFCYYYVWFDVAPAKENMTNVYIQRYIQEHKYWAINEMHRAGVPASITLAQGVLESKYGTSELAKKANNHFGIKIGKDWNGGQYCSYTKEWNKALGKMETKTACFRKYESAEHSYRHHSDFLTSRPRYASLFELNKTDYHGWAHGLQATGYATDPQYGKKLISLIERFHLYRYDADYHTIELFDHSPISY